MMNLRILKYVAAVVAFMGMSGAASAQKYSGGVVDKTVAVIGGEVIMISDIEEEVQVQMSNYTSDKTSRCELLEQMMSAKLFLMQARVDSLVINNDMVETTSASESTSSGPITAATMVSSRYSENLYTSFVRSGVKPLRTRLLPSRCRVRLQARFLA